MDRPIIFSGAMVRALLEGRKTQTRRLIKDDVRDPPGMDAVHPKNTIKHPAPYLDSYCGGPRTRANPRGMSDRWCWWTRDDRQCLPTFRVPFVPGDRLWVKEAHTWVGGGDPGLLLYRSTWREDAAGHGCENVPPTEPKGWRSPLFMPRVLSRLTLLVTDVRVERLAKISGADAIAEGATVRPRAYRGMDGWCMDWSPVGTPSRWAADGEMLSEEDVCFWRPEDAFGAFINELHDPRWNYKGDGLWGENPWVAAVTFHVVCRNVDALPPGMEALVAETAGLGAKPDSPSAESGAPSPHPLTATDPIKES